MSRYKSFAASLSIAPRDAPVTADFEDVVGAETARVTVEADEEEGEERALRGEATATAGLAHAVRVRDDATGATRGATTPDRTVLAASILEFVSILFLVSEERAETGDSAAGGKEGSGVLLLRERKRFVEERGARQSKKKIAKRRRPLLHSPSFSRPRPRSRKEL